MTPGNRGHYYWRHQSSVSSVEEAEEDIREDVIISGDKGDLKTSAEPKSKSPKYLPRFLRASFSRLISKEKSKSGSLSGQARGNILKNIRKKNVFD